MPTAIVTGASGNLGKAVAEKFLQEGYDVIGTVMHDTSGIDHQHFSETSLDLTNESAVASFVKTILQKNKTIDAVVLTAGGFTSGNIVETGMEAIAKQFSINFHTAYNLARPVFRQMLEQGEGRIFFIGSRPGSDMHKSKGMVAYGLSKSLLFNLAELINEEAAGKNIVASVVAPSTIDTPQNRKSMPAADHSKWVKPEEIASIIYFYCTVAASALREPLIKVYGNA
jgi:NAD(P)-dependent dehydrogenase (short-subunit alcohol dehydrogenase family)